MSVGLSYQSWVDTRPSDRRARALPLRVRATTGSAMAVLAFVEAAVLVAVVAAVGMPMGAWWTWVAIAGALAALATTGHYQARITLSAAREAGPVVACAAAPFVVLALTRVHGVSTPTLLETGASWRRASSSCAAPCTPWCVCCARGAGLPSARCSSAPGR